MIYTERFYNTLGKRKQMLKKFFRILSAKYPHCNVRIHYPSEYLKMSTSNTKLWIKFLTDKDLIKYVKKLNDYNELYDTIDNYPHCFPNKEIKLKYDRIDKKVEELILAGNHDDFYDSFES